MTTTMLVTGATGFIGSRVVAAASARGIDVIALARHAGAGPAERTISADIADRSAIRSALLRIRPTHVVHLAWYTEPRTYLTSRANLGCLAASAEFIADALDAGARRIVVAGTCAEYRPQPRPLREDDLCEPTTIYAAAKSALSTVAARLAADAGAELAWARVFSLYGPGEKAARAVPAAIDALSAGRSFEASSGEQVRDYLHVDDVASAIVAVALGGAVGPINVASGTGIAMRDLFALIADLTDRRELLRLGVRPANPWDPPMVVGDNARLRALGWAPRFDLREGLVDAIGSRRPR